MEGANPCKKHAGDLQEPTKTLQKTFPWHQKSKPSRKLRPKLSLFLPISGVATPQPSGSNPDRSPIAQWLNMRISPASQLPGLCLPASASRGPFKTRARPGVGGKPRAAGEVFRNHNTGPNPPLFKTLARASVGGKPRAAGKVFRNHNTGPNSPPFKTLAAYSPLILGYVRLFAAYSRLIPLICRLCSAYLPLICWLFVAYLLPLCCLFAAYSRFMMFKIRFHDCVSNLAPGPPHIGLEPHMRPGPV